MLRLKPTLLKFIFIDIIVIGVIITFSSRPLRHHGDRATKVTSSSNKPTCPLYPDSLQERLVVNTIYKPNEDEAIRNAGPHVTNGCYEPPDCAANQNLAVIIPYKNREQHLITLMHHMHPILQRQKLRYCIFVTEQYDDGAFNKARVMNAGVLELLKTGPYPFDCLIFQDVDMLVEDDRNLHRCLRFPHHLSSAIDKFKYNTRYGTDFGGVGAISPEQYFRINGHSNRFYGWGGEDTDLETRLHLSNIDPIPASHIVGRYKMIPHEHPWSFNPHTGTGSHYNSMSKNPNRKYHRFISTDNSGVSTIKYSVKSVLSHGLFTKFIIDVRTFIIDDAESTFDDFNNSVKVDNPFFTNTRNLEGQGRIIGFGIQDEITLSNQNCTFQNFPGKTIYHKPKNESDIFEDIIEDLNEAKNICITMLQNCSAIMMKSPGNFLLRPSPFMHDKILRFRKGPGFISKVVSSAYEGESVYMKICEKDARFPQILENPVKIDDKGLILRPVSHKTKFKMRIFQTEEFDLYYDFTIYSAHEAITRKYEIKTVDSAIFVKRGKQLVFNSTDNTTFAKFLGKYKNLDEVSQNSDFLHIVTPSIPMELYPGSYFCESSIIDGNDVTHLKWKYWFHVKGSSKESEKMLMDKYLPQATFHYSQSAMELLESHRGSTKLPYNGDEVLWSIIFSRLGNVLE